MKKIALLSSAIAACALSTAHAADLPVYKAPVAAPLASWSGLYVGGHGGGVWSRDRYTFDNGAATIERFEFNPTSYIAGGQAGYQLQTGGMVIGLEGTYSVSDLGQTITSAPLAPSTRSIRLDQFYTIAAKVGVVWNSSAMLYGKIGYVAGRMQGSSNNPVGITTSASQWGDGVTVGAGLDYRLFGNLIAGVAVDYYNLGFSNFATGSNPAGFTVGYNSGSASIVAVTGRLSYLFNGSM